MSEPKRHHIFAESFQKRFADADGMVWVYNKPKKLMRRLALDSAFVVGRLNTVVYKDGSRDSSLETAYSQLEGEVNVLIGNIVSHVRTGRKPRLALDQRELWDRFFYLQQKRAPDVYARLGFEDRFAEQIAEDAAELQQLGRPVLQSEIDELRMPATAKRLLQRVRVTARGRLNAEISEVLRSRGIAIAIISNSRHSFIMGDHPHAKMGPDSHLAHPLNERWFPIASDVAISPWGEAGSEHLFAFERGHVRQVNEIIYKQSNVVGARSEELLRSLAGLRANCVQSA